MWEIRDDNGVIYSGAEEEMQEVFLNIQTGAIILEFDGDLKLIQVHGVFK